MLLILLEHKKLSHEHFQIYVQPEDPEAVLHVARCSAQKTKQGVGTTNCYI